MANVYEDKIDWEKVETARIVVFDGTRAIATRDMDFGGRLAGAAARSRLVEEARNATDEDGLFFAVTDFETWLGVEPDPDAAARPATAATAEIGGATAEDEALTTLGKADLTGEAKPFPTEGMTAIANRSGRRLTIWARDAASGDFAAETIVPDGVALVVDGAFAYVEGDRDDEAGNVYVKCPSCGADMRKDADGWTCAAGCGVTAPRIAFGRKIDAETAEVLLAYGETDTLEGFDDPAAGPKGGGKTAGVLRMEGKDARLSPPDGRGRKYARVAAAYAWDFDYRVDDGLTPFAPKREAKDVAVTHALARIAPEGGFPTAESDGEDGGTEKRVLDGRTYVDTGLAVEAFMKRLADSPLERSFADNFAGAVEDARVHPRKKITREDDRARREEAEKAARKRLVSFVSEIVFFRGSTWLDVESKTDFFRRGSGTSRGSSVSYSAGTGARRSFVSSVSRGSGTSVGTSRGTGVPFSSGTSLGSSVSFSSGTSRGTAVGSKT